MSPQESEPSPTFVRGTTPYWEYGCGCKASALRMDRCELHALALGVMRLMVTEALGNPADEYLSVPTQYVREAARLSRIEWPDTPQEGA